MAQTGRVPHSQLSTSGNYLSSSEPLSRPMSHPLPVLWRSSAISWTGQGLLALGPVPNLRAGAHRLRKKAASPRATCVCSRQHHLPAEGQGGSVSAACTERAPPRPAAPPTAPPRHTGCCHHRAVATGDMLHREPRGAAATTIPPPPPIPRGPPRLLPAALAPAGPGHHRGCGRAAGARRRYRGRGAERSLPRRGHVASPPSARHVAAGPGRRPGGPLGAGAGNGQPGRVGGSLQGSDRNWKIKIK